jgi:hypothetical protein
VDLTSSQQLAQSRLSEFRLYFPHVPPLLNPAVATPEPVAGNDGSGLLVPAFAALAWLLVVERMLLLFGVDPNARPDFADLPKTFFDGAVTADMIILPLLL